MRTVLSTLLSLSTLAIASCLPAEEAETGRDGGGSGPVPSSSSSSSSSARAPGRPANAPPWPGGGIAPDTPPPLVAGWTSDGEVALFDAATGAVLASAAGGGLSGERDVAFDPWQSRILVFEGDPEGTWGEIASYALGGGGGGGCGGGGGDSGPSLGAREHEVWIDGVARVAASPFGAVVFEDGYGARWRLLRADGGASPSVSGPRPMSLATEVLADGGLRVTALTYGLEGDAPDLRVAQVGPTGIDAPVTVPVLAPPLSSPPAARWVVSAGGGHLADAVNGQAMITTFAGSGWPAWVPVGAGEGVTWIEQAAAFPGGDRVALLTSGGVDLIVFSTGPGGAPACAAALDLPGDPEKAPLFFARGLVPVSATRLLVATTSGVRAVDVSGDCPPSLAIDEDFGGGALRGPLDAWE